MAAGYFYNIPVADNEEIERMRKKLEEIPLSVQKARERDDASVGAAMHQADVIRSSDFNFLTMLGKGSFGKVRVFLCTATVLKSISGAAK